MSSGIVGTSCTATEITLSESHENEISVWRASADLNSLVKMGERLKGALRGYLKYRLIMRIIWAFVGVVVGIAGCIVFAKVYHNYNAAIWAGVSALFAVVFLHLHFAVRRDIERIIPRSKFTVIMYIGLTGLIAGVVGFFTNLALGIHRHETGILIVVLIQPSRTPPPTQLRLFFRWLLSLNGLGRYHTMHEVHLWDAGTDAGIAILRLSVKMGCCIIFSSPHPRLKTNGIVQGYFIKIQDFFRGRVKKYGIFGGWSCTVPQMIPRPQLIPKMDRKWSSTVN